jgi:hypothetical protein
VKEKAAVLACFNETCPVCEKKGGLSVEVLLFRELPRSREGTRIGTCRDVELGAERKVHCGHCHNDVTEFSINRAVKAREAERTGNMATAMNLYSSLNLFEDVQRLESIYGPVTPLQLEQLPEALGYGLRPAWEDEPVNTDERVRIVAPAPDLVPVPEKKHWGLAAALAIGVGAVIVEVGAFLVMVSVPILIVISVTALGTIELARRFVLRRTPEPADEAN